MYDISKIPDIYDSIKYDVLHNSIDDLPALVRCPTCHLIRMLMSIVHVFIPCADAVRPHLRGGDAAERDSGAA